MADTNKENLVEKLTNIADGFRTSRSLTETLSLDDMATLAAVPITSGDNLLGSFIDGSLTEITAADLGDITTLRSYMIYEAPITSFEIPSTIQSFPNYCWSGASSKLTTIKYDGTTGDWASLPWNGDSPIPTNAISHIDTMWFRNSQGEYYMVDDTLEIAPTQEGRIRQYSFYKFTRPRNIIIPSSVKIIGNYAFAYCSNCITLTLNEGVEEISNGAFRYCDAIQDLVIPNSVQEIGLGAFRNSQFLNEVRIGNGITSLASSTFQNCPNLTDIYIDAPEGSVSNAPWGATEATVHWNTPLPSNNP